ncbi:Hypothetical predicted protein [Scomber scombrus]|uniref:Uncharacterized protein n=1 Tax=Scomber scombrus TaxID=13677 RepID=A0AAV1PJR6_SCOSC
MRTPIISTAQSGYQHGFHQSNSKAFVLCMIQSQLGLYWGPVVMLPVCGFKWTRSTLVMCVPDVVQSRGPVASITADLRDQAVGLDQSHLQHSSGEASLSEGPLHRRTQSPPEQPRESVSVNESPSEACEHLELKCTSGYYSLSD